MRIQFIRNMLFPAVLLSLLQSCSTFGPSPNIEYGRLVLDARVEETGNSEGPWWDYKLWLKHRDSGKVEVIPVTVARGMTMVVSLPLPAGEYDVIAWRWDTEDYNLDLPDQPEPAGEFEIFDQMATVLDKSLVIRLTPMDQSATFIKQQQPFTQTQFDALVAGNKKLRDLGLHWQRTVDFQWSKPE